VSIEKSWKPENVLDNPIYCLAPFAEIMPAFLGERLTLLMPVTDNCEDAGQVIIALSPDVLQQAAFFIVLEWSVIGALA
jgi:hypothetical protein